MINFTTFSFFLSLIGAVEDQSFLSWQQPRIGHYNHASRMSFPICLGHIKFHVTCPEVLEKNIFETLGSSHIIWKDLAEIYKGHEDENIITPEPKFTTSEI